MVLWMISFDKIIFQSDVNKTNIPDKLLLENRYYTPQVTFLHSKY